MRAAFGLVGLLLVLAIVMLNARNSVQSSKVPAASDPTRSGESSSPRAQTEAVRQQVQGLADQAAQRASEAGAP